MNPIRALAGIALATFTVAAAAAAIQGEVVKREDGAPIAGAFVILKWERAASCVWVEVVKTDRHGTYVIPARNPGIEPSVTAYAPGMVPAGTPEPKPAAESAPGGALIRMERFRGTDEQRARALASLDALEACAHQDLVRILTPLYQAADAEWRGLAAKGARGDAAGPLMASLEALQRRSRDEAARAPASAPASPEGWEMLKSLRGSK